MALHGLLAGRGFGARMIRACIATWGIVPRTWSRSIPGGCCWSQFQGPGGSG